MSPLEDVPLVPQYLACTQWLWLSSWTMQHWVLHCPLHSSQFQGHVHSYVFPHPVSQVGVGSYWLQQGVLRSLLLVAWQQLSRKGVMLCSWALGPHFFFLSWPLCTYTITWPWLTWLLTCTTEPSCRELHCSLLLYAFYCSLLMVVCDHHCSWLYCSMTFIVCDSIVLLFCMLSQVAALLYISWTNILELGLKPDLVCNLLCSKSLLLDKPFPSFISLEISSNPWRYSPFLFIFTQTLVLATLSLLSPSKAL